MKTWHQELRAWLAIKCLSRRAKLTYHNGWWHGNNASFVRMIQEDATIIVLGNKFTHAIYKTKYLCSSFNSKLLPDREGRRQ